MSLIKLENVSEPGKPATKVYAISLQSGEVHEMILKVSIERIQAWAEGKDQRLVQIAFPELSADEREFLMTGITPEEWNQMFGNEREE